MTILGEMDPRGLRKRMVPSLNASSGRSLDIVNICYEGRGYGRGADVGLITEWMSTWRRIDWDHALT